MAASKTRQCGLQQPHGSHFYEGFDNLCPGYYTEPILETQRAIGAVILDELLLVGPYPGGAQLGDILA